MAFFPRWHTVNTRRLNTNWKGIIKTKAKKNAKRHLSSVGTRGFHRKHCTYPLFPLGTTASAPRPCCGLRNSFPKSRTGGARGNCTSIAKALGNVKILSGVYKGASLKISDDLEQFPDAPERRHRRQRTAGWRRGSSVSVGGVCDEVRLECFMRLFQKHFFWKKS